MAQLVEYVEELIKEVGPRPAGTQQEHQAAELIAARLDESGMSVDIEEFSCARNQGWAKALSYALAVLGAVIVAFSSLGVLGIILVLAGGILMLLDYLGKNPLLTLFNNSLSQNVIARYTSPANDQPDRSRKVVIMAHYDSSRTMVQAAPPLIKHFSLLNRAIRAAMVLLTVFALLCLIPFPSLLHLVLVVIMIVGAVLLAVAMLMEIINLFMPYSEGANCNGSGIGVLYGLAKILTSGVDVANFREATGQTKKRKSAAEQTDLRALRTDRESNKAKRGREKQRPSVTTSSGSLEESAAAISSGSGRFEGLVRERSSTRAAAADAAPSAMAAAVAATAAEAAGAAGAGAGVAPGGAVSAGAAEGLENGQQLDSTTPAQGLPGGPVASVADQLVKNPYVSQRPPLAEIEETKRQREEEQAKRQEKQRKQELLESGHTEDGVPLWYANAKKKAEERAERRRTGEEDTGVVRSRFADVPISGRLEKPHDEIEAAGAQAGAGGAGGEPGAGAGGAADVTAEQGGVQDLNPQAGAAAVKAKPLAAGAPTSAMDILPDGTAGPGRAVAPQPQPQAGAQPQAEPQPQASSLGTETQTGTLNPDFSGIDRAAFKVLPGEEAHGPKVIVPAEAVSLAEETDSVFDREPDKDAADTEQVALIAAEEMRGRLRAIPSLSKENTGNIPAMQPTFDEAPVSKEELFSPENSLVSATGAFVPLGTTGVMKPLGQELLAYHDESEIYIADADDTSIAEQYSETGEYSELDLVDIPESRVKSFFGSMGDRLSGRKKEKLDDAPSSWLGVDKGYDARKEGRDIGSWDNFGDDEWRGGAFGGTSYQENVNAVMNLSNELLDKEVWLVALGASESGNAGFKDFYASHGNELRNALFINVMGVGMGDLVFTLLEGNNRPAQTDPRMQSLIGSAAQSMAIPVGPVDFTLFGTDATAALKAGSRAISILGLGDKEPYGWRWTDSDTSRLREDNLQDTIALIVETIKNI